MGFNIKVLKITLWEYLKSAVLIIIKFSFIVSSCFEFFQVATIIISTIIELK